MEREDLETMTGRSGSNLSFPRDQSPRRVSRRDSENDDDESLSSLRFDAYNFIRKTSRPFEKYYELGAMLGEGAFGVVHSCVHLATRSTRAVKILPKSETSSKDNKLAYQEFKMMAKLDHPNIAKTYELYEGKTSFYIVTDLYKGSDLFDVVEQKGTLSEYETASVVSTAL
jgi:calcium-dependent protein kinase